MLISSGFLAAISFVATFVMAVQRKYENAFTRLCVAIFYLALTIQPSIPIETARILNRWFWVLVLGVEVVWWIVITIIKWRKEKRS